MKLLGSTENKFIKDKNGKNESHLEITEVRLIHCNIGMIIKKIEEFFIHLIEIVNLVN